MHSQSANVLTHVRSCPREIGILGHQEGILRFAFIKSMSSLLAQTEFFKYPYLLLTVDYHYRRLRPVSLSCLLRSLHRRLTCPLKITLYLSL
jgi:hypothetical protein